MAAYDPVAARARSKVANEIYAGRLKRKPCETCGTTRNVDAHHDDYSKPLDVRWLCKLHHRLHHLAIRAAAEDPARPKRRRTGDDRARDAA